MTIAASPLFEVTVVGDVTIVKLLDPDRPPRNGLNRIDVNSMIQRIQEPPQQPNLETWQQLRRDLLLLLDTSKPAKLILDLSGLDTIGSEPIISTVMNSVYAAARKHSSQFGCQWRVCGLADHLRAVFTVSALSGIFPDLHAARSDAIAAFSGANHRAHFFHSASLESRSRSNVPMNGPGNLTTTSHKEET